MLHREILDCTYGGGFFGHVVLESTLGCGEEQTDIVSAISRVCAV